MSFAERLSVVRACNLVDRVLDAPPPLHCTCAFLDSIGASYACHGDDMDEAELRFWYGDIEQTGRLRTVRYTPVVSTRQIIERVVSRHRNGTLRT